MHHSKPLATLAALSLLTLAPAARADVKLPALFSDHMVLQRETAVPVWGWAAPGEEVQVAIGGQTKTTTADASGKWAVKLDKLSAGPALTLLVTGKNTVSVQDVLVGEVWLASGQSNMAMVVRNARDFEEAKAAAKFPEIRMFTVARKPARTPQTDCGGKWVVCSPDTVGGFSATAYFFGRELHRKLGVPVGLVNSSVGGTPIEAWTSLDVQQAKSELQGLLASWEKKDADFNPETAKEEDDKRLQAYREAAKKAKVEGKTPPRPPQRRVQPRDDPHYPAVLFNGMIAPLVSYALRGAIWYQGESNAGSPESSALYALQLPLLIADWRGRWSEGDFPFAWVQLPNYKGSRGWPFMREAMLKTLAVPDTGMTVNIDIGEVGDIHPKNKQDVGRRLALWARTQVYGEKISWSGPLPAGHKVHGDTVELRVRHTDGGLVAKGGELRGFLVAGADKQWKPATARIEGDKVLVSTADVQEPVAVRYAWASNPDGNLYNGEGLPASPFRTDDWPPAVPAK